MSFNYIQIPIRIEAKLLNNEERVTNSFADFTRLPWEKDGIQYNFNNPYLGNEIINHPFSNSNNYLKKGLHLHFILPHFLGRPTPSEITGEAKEDTFPSAPNRWLVTKSKGKKTIKQWVVESDYVHPITDSKMEGISIFPATTNQQPYRNIGRVVELKEGETYVDNIESTEFNDLTNSPLSAIGYGDINFASFYPNCQSIFGFHEENTSDIIGCSYTVIGWNSSSDDDIVSNAINKLGDVEHIDDEGKKVKLFPTPKSISEYLDECFELDILITDDQAYRSVFFGEIEIDSTENIHNAPEDVNIDEAKIDDFNTAIKNDSIEKLEKRAYTFPGVQISVGNNEKEALSALLGHTLNMNLVAPEKNYDFISDTRYVIENQLESILLFDQLNKNSNDVRSKFLESRHEKGFTSIESGSIWELRMDLLETDRKDNAKQESLTIPNNITIALNVLNDKQLEYNRKHKELGTLQKQLFLDWHKYMQASYPTIEGQSVSVDSNQIKFLIENATFNELKTKISDTGKLQYTVDEKNDESIILQIENNNEFPDSNNESTARQLFYSWEKAIQLITTWNSKSDNTNKNEIVLFMKPGSRYWEPNSPSVLLSYKSDDPAIKTIDPDYSNSLSTNLINASEASIKADNTFEITKKLIEKERTKFKPFTSNPISEKKWEPFILEWEAELFNPNLLNEEDAFKSEAIQDQFRLDEFGPDFKLKNNFKQGDRSLISGSTLLNTHAKTSMLYNIQSFFEKVFNEEKIQFKGSDKTSKWFEQFKLFLEQKTWGKALDTIEWNSKDDVDADAKAKLHEAWKDQNYSTNPYKTAWKSYKRLSQMSIISQSLSGFNEACYMQWKRPQLPISDPLGFASDKLFAQQVDDNVRKGEKHTPLSFFDFNPIRSGKMNLSRLRLIDNFGTPYDLNLRTSGTYKPIAALPLQSEEKPVNPFDDRSVFLRPRLSQASCLNFEFLPSNYVHGSENPIKDRTMPICGWLKVNQMDKSIAVFDEEGSSIGSVDKESGWNLLPWNKEIIDLEENIKNDTLRAVVKDLVAKSSDPVEFEKHIDTLQASLNAMAPSNSSLFDSTTALMGRAIAVVRVAMDIKLMELAAIDQSWSALNSDLSNNNQDYNNRSNKNWTDIKLPCRLGEHHQLNDGLVGYWKEDDSLKTQAPSISNFKFVLQDDIREAGQNTELLSINKTQYYTMLIDPRGVIHATTGILPVKSIAIPAQMYSDTIKKLSMWYKSAPLLQPTFESDSSIVLNVPNVEGYSWEWWGRFNGPLKITEDIINKSSDQSSQLLDGWLILNPSERN